MRHVGFVVDSLPGSRELARALGPELEGGTRSPIAGIVKTPWVRRADNAHMTINWRRAVAGALVAEIAQVAAAVGWVAIYSHFINPGQPMAAYHAHAQASGPWVSILAGAPIFYTASRWIAKSRPTALALFGVYLAIDGALLVGMTESWAGVPLLPIGLSFLTKLGACVLGGRRG